jgi:hypothetical protein
VESKFNLATTKSGDLVAEELLDGVYLIKNALTPYEIEYLHNLAKSTTEDGWRVQYFAELTSQAVSLYGDDVGKIEDYIKRNKNEYWSDKVIKVPNEDLCDNILNRVMPFFGDKYDLGVFYEIQRQSVGEGLDEHYDGGYDPRLLRAVIFYINDDFNGGELYFPKQNFEYRPVAGDFITFPSSDDYLHGVKKVQPGPNRYALASFAWEAGIMEEWVKDH